jgi:disabled family protein 2
MTPEVGLLFEKNWLYLTKFIFLLCKEKTITPVRPVESSESWAVFDDMQVHSEKTDKKIAGSNAESGSSDGKLEWKQREKAYHKRWPKPNTSSSSRDVSPWEDGPEKKRHPQHPLASHYHHSSNERYARPPAPSNRHRTDSLEEEYYDERRPPPLSSRIKKSSMHRSKEILESDSPNWYHPAVPPPLSDHWYGNDEEDDDGKIERLPPRPFDRNAYERSTFGPPFDKREPRSYQGFDRSERKIYDKRSKYYRTYSRPEYEPYDPYDLPPPHRVKPSKKEYDEYEKNFERGVRESRSAREYFYDYDRDRRSFDSNESYDSTGRMRRMNSGEVYGSYESNRNDYRDRYTPSSQGGGRISRKNQRSRGTIDDDSDEIYRENSGGSLQRQTVRSKHSNIKLDDEVWSSSGGNKYWKQRPSSATAGDKFSGSEGEREKRYRRKVKQSGRNKETELRSNYATIRYSQKHEQFSRRDYDDYDKVPSNFVSEIKPVDDNINSSSPLQEYYTAVTRKKHSIENIKLAAPRVGDKILNDYAKPAAAARYPTQSYEESDDDNFICKGRVSKKNLNLEKGDAQEHISASVVDTNVCENQNDANIISKKQIILRRTEQRDHQDQVQKVANEINNKFSIDGFESDFTSSPKPIQSSSSSHHEPPRQENQDFTFDEKEIYTSPNAAKMCTAGDVGNGSSATTQPKLRFNENVSVSKFDKNSSSQQMFEDDFLQSWSPELSGSGSNIQMQSSLKKTLVTSSYFNRQENIKKSDSINIFARKVDEDPFANDDFFNADDEIDRTADQRDEKQDPFQWDSKNNFANFNSNKNI